MTISANGIITAVRKVPQNSNVLVYAGVLYSITKERHGVILFQDVLIALITLMVLISTGSACFFWSLQRSSPNK